MARFFFPSPAPYVVSAVVQAADAAASERDPHASCLWHDGRPGDARKCIVVALRCGSEEGWKQRMLQQARALLVEAAESALRVVEALEPEL